jgi:HlyD family secretion protein
MKQMGMDRRIEKKKWSRERTIYLAGAIGLIIVLFFAFRALNKKVYKLDQSTISVREVIAGDFQDIILIDGDVESINLVLVNTLEGGTVDEIFIEDGVYVEKGTPLLRLSNPAVTLNYMNQETAIVEQINNLRNLKLALEKDQRNLNEALLDSENRLSEIERDYKIDSLLYQKEVIAKNDYVEVKESYEYQLKKRDFMNNNVKKSTKDNRIQIAQINNSIALMERNLAMIHTNIEKMLVRAPVSGMLSSFDPVIGETYQRNETVAKIDVQSGFKIIGSVDEYYITMVKEGQNAVFTFDGEMIKLEVKKVLPEVTNRRFEIELIFVNEVPEAISIGQSIQARLELSRAQHSLMIPRGNYFQSSGGQFVFVLDGKGEAHKRNIRLGSQNPTHYQVLGGLEEGDRFISSSYDDYLDYKTVKINP